jgi:poly(A) polymerase
MYALQPRLEVPGGRRALRLLEQPRFRAAFDLLALRAAIGLAPAETAQWWTTLQVVSPEEREQMADAMPRSARGAASAADDSGTAPRRRRRRRSRSRGG